MKKGYCWPVGPLATNWYALAEGGVCLVFDVGSGGKAIADHLKELGLQPLAVLLTHRHFDHCYSVKTFLQSFPEPVYAFDTPNDPPFDMKCEHYRIPARDVGVTNFVQDGQTLHIGPFSVNVLHTPGHTFDGVCYLIDDKMFSGDTLFHLCVGRSDLDDGNRADLNRSLRRLARLEGNYTVYPGHNEQTTLDFERKYNIDVLAAEREV